MAPLATQKSKTVRSEPYRQGGNSRAWEQPQSGSCRHGNQFVAHGPVSSHSYDFDTDRLMCSRDSHHRQQARTWPSEKKKAFDIAVRQLGEGGSLNSRRNGVGAWMDQSQCPAQGRHSPLIEATTMLFGHGTHRGRDPVTGEVQTSRGSPDLLVGVGAQFETQ